jgi:hypothetical protein
MHLQVSLAAIDPPECAKRVAAGAMHLAMWGWHVSAMLTVTFESVSASHGSHAYSQALQTSNAAPTGLFPMVTSGLCRARMRWNHALRSVEQARSLCLLEALSCLYCLVPLGPGMREESLRIALLVQGDKWNDAWEELSHAC